MIFDLVDDATAVAPLSSHTREQFVHLLAEAAELSTTCCAVTCTPPSASSSAASPA